MSMRGHKPKPGRIVFVGSGPGDPGLLTTRARTALTNAALVLTDPDVPEPVLALIGTDLPPVSGPDPAETETDPDRSETGAPSRPDIRPALGEPAEVAKMLTAEARSGADVVRLVAGDPLSVDAVITEVIAVARTHLHFEIVPGLPATGAVPTYAGLPLGSSHTVADVRGDVDWGALAAAPGPLILQATASHLPDAARTLIEYGLSESTPCVVSVAGTTCAQRSLESTLQGLTASNALAGIEQASPAGGQEPAAGPLVVTIGKTVANRAKLNWWESRALYGWTVLVPRTKDQAGEMSERLVEHGARPVEVPTIAVEPPRSPAQMERAIKGLVDGRYQWVVFTSTNAVRAVWEKFGEFGLDARAFSGVKIACVGEATADRVRAFGINPELVPSGEQSSLGLLDEFPPYDAVFDPVNRVLLPRADIATETLAEGLRERGWEIEDVTAYRTVRAAPPPAAIREMIKTGGFDAVCFTSSSTVRNLVGIAGKPHARTIVACIGPKTAETAAEFGLRVDVRPDIAAVGPLVDALAEHAARLRAEGALPPPRKKSRRR
ncbi:MAG TPA: bifunctional uroporphyrinogen-III C-methyltransferase/uroporphyrinogen-III synthase [Mycobacterium sp.]|nr:bifunctional uroporphyrinogen-III C-methyltransferase/uroporphyrinogen-III synthase [Mycobacterium sp.]